MVIILEVIGIICEYNPFHNGHIYHLQQIKNKYPESILILVLNGYFLQRGEISIISKKDKVQIALNNNIDLIIELPVLFGTQSADTFAYNAVFLLNQLKVNRIIFGSETNNISQIIDIAKKSESLKESSEIRTFLNQGLNYPTALAKGLNMEFTYLPNDLLAISYVKAILKINKNIIPESIKRTNDYLDITSNDSIISASNIRNKIKNKEDISDYLPSISQAKILNINDDKFFDILKVIIMQDHHLNEILDVNEGIEFRLKKCILKATNLDELRDLVKTKRYTYNKINRMFIHIILGITKKDATLPCDYIKILGFNTIGKHYLNTIRKNITLPLSNYKKSKIFQYELKAALLYDLLTNTNNFEQELSNKPIIY